MAWLSPPDPVDNLKKSLARRSPGTGEWYLRSRQYESWKTRKASISWLHGSVGSGKTLLSAGIIDDLQWPASDQQLLRALRDTLASRPSSFIVLDALDECNYTGELFDMLEEMQSWSESSLHVLVTSRNIIGMREGLEDLVPIGMRTCLQSQVVDKDIQAYVHLTLLEEGPSRVGRRNGRKVKLETS